MKWKLDLKSILIFNDRLTRPVVRQIRSLLISSRSFGRGAGDTFCSIDSCVLKTCGFNSALIERTTSSTENLSENWEKWSSFCFEKSSIYVFLVHRHRHRGIIFIFPGEKSWKFFEFNRIFIMNCSTYNSGKVERKIFKSVAQLRSQVCSVKIGPQEMIKFSKQFIAALANCSFSFVKKKRICHLMHITLFFTLMNTPDDVTIQFIN